VNETRSPLVLIVEDNPTNLMLIVAVLRRAGYRTVTAVDAATAAARLAEERPDAIIMDIQLPGEDGLTFTGRLRADPATAAIPIVALTAHAMKGDRERALAAGCDGFFTKPINTRTFARELAEVLSRHPGDLSRSVTTERGRGA